MKKVVVKEQCMRHFLAMITGAALSLMGLLPVAQAEVEIKTGFFSSPDNGSTMSLEIEGGNDITLFAFDLSFEWGGDLYTDPAIQTAANAKISSTTPFKGSNWTIRHVRIFGPGNYSFDVDCTAEQIEAGIVDCLVTQPAPGSNFPEGRILTLNVGPGQIGAHLLGDWNQSKDIGVVQLWDINTVFAGSRDGGTSAGNDLKGVFFTLVSVDTDNDGIPGGRMLTGPLTGSNVSFNFNLTATFPLTNSQDADSDGIPDDQDVIDNRTNTTQQQGIVLEGGNFLLESSTGTIILGDRAAIKAISTDNYNIIVGTDALGAIDPDVSRACVGGCFSFTITGVRPEVAVDTVDAVDIVLPLSEAIPINAVVRRLINVFPLTNTLNSIPNIAKETWVDFDSNGADAIMSASGSAGSCPSVTDSSSWAEGLSVGDFCLKLTLTEGGVNDADATTNNVIKNSLGVAIVINTDAIDDNTNNSGGGCTVTARSIFDPTGAIIILLLWLFKCIKTRKKPITA